MVWSASCHSAIGEGAHRIGRVDLGGVGGVAHAELRCEI
jgi:hypothetical protein